MLHGWRGEIQDGVTPVGVTPVGADTATVITSSISDSVLAAGMAEEDTTVVGLEGVTAAEATVAPMPTIPPARPEGIPTTVMLPSPTALRLWTALPSRQVSRR